MLMRTTLAAVAVTALSLAACSRAPGAAGGTAGRLPPPGAEPERTDVHVAGTGAYHTYRIPAVVATPRGALLAFAEGRLASAADAGDIDIVVRRSEDGGRTWSPVRVVVENGRDAPSNPCPVVDARTGTIFLLHTRNAATDLERDIIAGRSRGTPTVWVVRSEDDGETWSAPLEITASVKRPGWTWYATGPGVGIQTLEWLTRGQDRIL